MVADIRHIPTFNSFPLFNDPKKKYFSPDNNLSLCLAISHWVLSLIGRCTPHPHHPLPRFLMTPLPFTLLFVSPKPLMLSVVNGLASCFKAAIAECKFWLLRFIYILVSWSLLYIWVVAMGMTQCKQKVEIIRKIVSPVFSPFEYFVIFLKNLWN